VELEFLVLSDIKASALAIIGALTLADFLAVSSGVLQAFGYAFYIRLSLADEVEPNPVTWLMFSYGTTLLTVIEFASGATWRELALPVTCSGGSLVVAGICTFRGSMRAPRSRLEVGAFINDIVLTIAYCSFWWTESTLAGSAEFESIANAGFLACSNATTVTAFIPILASTRARPEEEIGAPWLVWTLAYTSLFVATLSGVRGYENATLLIYPLSNLILHATVALFALTGMWVAGERAIDDLCVRDTNRTGKGLFARRAFARGEHVFTMTGSHRRYAIRTEEESTRYENWLGIGKDLYIVPDRPFVYANHSCEPNLGVRDAADFVALRDIATGEELTFDYSITTDELTWRMKCNCGAPSCRLVVGGIQFLPAETFERYLPFVNPFFQLVYRRHNQLSE
jgi:hypothetical protein